MKLAILWLAVASLQAEEIMKMINIKYADVQKVQSILGNLGKGVTFSIDTKFVGLKGERALVESLEQIIQKVDVAPLNIELTFEILGASREAGKGTVLPAALSAVAKEMKTILGYANVTLTDTIFLRSKEGRSSDASGLLPSLGDKAIYNLRVQQMTVDGEKGNRQVRIGDLRFGAKVPVPNDKAGNFSYMETGLNTSLDIKEGQRVVVGKAGLDASANPIFLVVSCKVID